MAQEDAKDVPVVHIPIGIAGEPIKQGQIIASDPITGHLIAIPPTSFTTPPEVLNGVKHFYVDVPPTSAPSVRRALMEENTRLREENHRLRHLSRMQIRDEYGCKVPVENPEAYMALTPHFMGSTQTPKVGQILRYEKTGVRVALLSSNKNTGRAQVKDLSTGNILEVNSDKLTAFCDGCGAGTGARHAHTCATLEKIPPIATLGKMPPIDSACFVKSDGNGSYVPWTEPLVKLTFDQERVPTAPGTIPTANIAIKDMGPVSVTMPPLAPAQTISLTGLPVPEPERKADGTDWRDWR